jgi:hypothetical protein
VESPERSHVGHDELEPVVQLEDGTLVDTRANATYCGSCYGTEDKPGDCCNTCAEVRERYRLRGWAFASAGAVAQCKREGFLEQVAIQAGEGCQVYGHIEVNKGASYVHQAPACTLPAFMALTASAHAFALSSPSSCSCGQLPFRAGQVVPAGRDARARPDGVWRGCLFQHEPHRE